MQCASAPSEGKPLDQGTPISASLLDVPQRYCASNMGHGTLDASPLFSRTPGIPLPSDLSNEPLQSPAASRQACARCSSTFHGLFNGLSFHPLPANSNTNARHRQSRQGPYPYWPMGALVCGHIIVAHV